MAKTPHKHADLIKAWADGAKIEFRAAGRMYWTEIANPSWDPIIEYRIKHEPVVEEFYGIVTVMVAANGPLSNVNYFDFEEWPHWTRKKGGRDNLKLTFIDGKLEGAEVLK